MQQNSGSSGNFQKIGEGLGGLMGQAADAATNMLGNMMGSMGGWWAQAASQPNTTRSFSEQEDRACRNHFEASARGGGSSSGQSSGGGMSGSIHVEGSTGAGGGSAGQSSSSSSSGAGASGGGTGSASWRYEDVRPLYQFGHVAGQNPDYQGRSFSEVEPELQREWKDEQTQRYGSWPQVRGYIDFGYSQSSSNRPPQR